MIKNNSIIFLQFLIFFSCQHVKQTDFLPTVEVKQVEGKYQLYRHGEPYYILGASGNVELEKVARYGGNSVRTWSMHEADQILDSAHYHRLTVTLGLEVGKASWGDDFNYWNFREVDRKIEELRQTVEKYKDHPALLMWGIGNEVHLYGGNRLLILFTINRIARMIHETDPNHPVMTTIPIGPNFDKYAYMRILCPDLDILGLNAFERLPLLFEEVRSLTGWNKAYVITEYGPPGPWDYKGPLQSNDTEWGAPREKSSTENAEYMEKYTDLIKGDTSLCLGGYAFYWGHKYEITHSWFSMFSQEGYETESVNVLQREWSGKSPENWAPRIDSLKIESKLRKDNLYLIADSLYNASVFAHDPDNDRLTFRWELRPEGESFHIIGNFDYNMKHLLFPENCPSIQFRTPVNEGGYRLLVFVYDDMQHVATHNIPFYTIVK